MSPNFLLADATFQHSIITPIVQRSSASLFNTDVVTFSFTRLAIQVVTSDESWNISVLYCLQHITDTFHEFVLLNFSSSSNTKPSTVSTDHYVCCYINCTDILHHEIVLLLKDVSIGLVTNQFASIL